MIDKYGRTHTGQLPGGVDINVAPDINPVAASPSPVESTAAKNDLTEDEVEQHPRAEFLLSIARTVANQALFVASFSLAAQTRLITSGDTVTHDGALSYIVCMTITTCFCMICAAGLTNFDVLMTDMLRSGLTAQHACDLFAERMNHQVFLLCSLFAVGCVSFLAGLGLLGWGIGISDGSPDGGKYSQYSVVIAVASASSSGFLMLIVVIIVASANRIRRQFSSIQSVDIHVSMRSATYEVFMAEISMVGEQVTLCCGYVSVSLNHRTLLT